jgi:hypothetical protein
MAKMFYTLPEAQAKLKRSPEEIKQYAREGRLREFRDGPRVMFKADQVDSLSAEINLGASPPPTDPYAGPDLRALAICAAEEDAGCAAQRSLERLVAHTFEQLFSEEVLLGITAMVVNDAPRANRGGLDLDDARFRDKVEACVRRFASAAKNAIRPL